jgi:hypothetical protein
MDEAIPLLPVAKELPIDSPLNQLDNRVLSRYSMEGLTLALENLQFQHTYLICGHCSLNNDGSLQICNISAGSGTSHEGQGRCQQHDSPFLKAQSPYIRQLSQYRTLQELFAEFEGIQGSVKDLKQELSIARTVLAAKLRQLDGSVNPVRNNEHYRDILFTLESIRKVAKSMADIEQAESQGITVNSINGYLWQMQNILNEEITDNNTLVRIFDRIATECKFITA